MATASRAITIGGSVSSAGCSAAASRAWTCARSPDGPAGRASSASRSRSSSRASDTDSITSAPYPSAARASKSLAPMRRAWLAASRHAARPACTSPARMRATAAASVTSQRSRASMAMPAACKARSSSAAASSNASSAMACSAAARLAPSAASRIPRGQREGAVVRDLRQRVGGRSLQRPGDVQVDARPRPGVQVAVQGLAHLHVREPPPPRALRPDQPGPFSLGQGGLARAGCGAADGGQRAGRERPPDHRRRPQQRPHRPVDAIQAPADHLAHRFGQGHLVPRAQAQAACPALAVQPQQLVEEQRVALAGPFHRLQQPRLRRLPQHRGHQLANLVARQRRQRQVGPLPGDVGQHAAGLGRQPRLLGPVGAQHQDGQPAQRPGHEVQQRQRRGIAGVQIVEHQQQRTARPRPCAESRRRCRTA